MLNATTFTYDGNFSGEFGLMIAQVEADNFQETAPFQSIIHTVKTPKSKRFSFAGIENEEMPQFQFQIFSPQHEPLSDIVQRELLTWLVGRNGFRKLQFHQIEYQDYEYNCIFAEVGKQYVHGFCHGIILTATFDSQYAYGKPRKKILSSDGGEWVELRIINDSDIIDDYVYPEIVFRQREPVDDNSIIILNSSDRADLQREFKFDALAINERVIVDNELRLVARHPNSISNSGNLLSKFNLNWLRLVKGVNILKVRINGECTIECPQYVKIGF